MYYFPLLLLMLLFNVIPRCAICCNHQIALPEDLIQLHGLALPRVILKVSLASTSLFF